MRNILALVALTILVSCAYTQDMPQPGVCGVSVIKPKPGARIINGEPVIPNSRPYQLLLVGYYPNGTAKYYCGASLVKPTHALTAAHCVVGNDAKDIRLFAGLHNFTTDVFKPENGIPIQSFFSHESYSSSSLANDYAVIRLKVPLQVDNIKIGLICLPTTASSACTSGTPVVASGWGSTSGDPNRPPSSRPVQLQQVGLQCVDGNNANCKRLTYVLGFIQEKSKLCAYGEWKSVCFGDSGGPLVRERTLPDGTKYLEQAGIMSGTVDCSFTQPYPDIYADVRYNINWILTKIRDSP